MTRLVLATLVLLGLAAPGWAACPVVKRSSAVLRQFQRLHPCPSTGLQSGKCDGWVKDHRWPLCAGGSDNLDNLIWSPVDEAKLKDQWERALCRRICATPPR